MHTHCYNPYLYALQEWTLCDIEQLQYSTTVDGYVCLAGLSCFILYHLLCPVLQLIFTVDQVCIVQGLAFTVCGA